MGDGVLVIDTGWTKQDAENLKAQIKEKTKGKPVRWIVMTQTDIDSNGGIEAFLPTDATVFVHARAVGRPVERACSAPRPGQKRPTVVGVADQLVVNAGERRLEIVASPGARALGLRPRRPLQRQRNRVRRGPRDAGPLPEPRGRVPRTRRLDRDARPDPKSSDPAGLVATRGDPTRLVRPGAASARAPISSASSGSCRSRRSKNARPKRGWRRSSR